MGANIDADHVGALEIEYGPQIAFDPYRIDGFLIERREMMNLVRSKLWIEWIALKPLKGFFR